MKGRIYKTIPAELVSAAEGGVVVSADGVYDYLLEKNLETINGEKANTSDLAAIAFSGSYSDLSDTPVIPEIPHNVSSFDNDVGYLTQHQPLKTINGENLIGTGNIEIIGGGGGSSEPLIQSDWNLTDNSAVDYIKNKPSIPTIPSNISAFNNDAGYLTLHLDISGKADKSTLARVATTGSYNDLTDTPITPTIAVLPITGGHSITITDKDNPNGQSFTVMNGADGSNGVNGTNGVDGTTPHIDLSTGNWFIGSTNTGVHAQGPSGLDGSNGQNGTNGTDGITPHIDPVSKHWMIGQTDTGIIAEGLNGSDGSNGQDGADGHTPVITATKSGTVTTIYSDSTLIATINDGQDGQNGTNGTNGTDGVTPHIDSTTGNWFIGTTDTGVHAQGPAGQDGLNGSNGTNGTNGIDGVSPEVTIATISGGHNVTITDANHPSGQSFNVMDGTLANQIQADWNLTTDSAPDYIKNKPTIPAEVTEATVTNWGFTKNTGNSNFSGSYNDLTDKPTIPSLTGYATETWVGQLGFLTLHQSLTNYIQKNQTAGLVKNDGTIDTNTYLTLHQSLTDYALKSELFSGSYTDLTDKPSIPTKTSDLTNDSGYLTQHQSLTNYATKTFVSDKIAEVVGAAPETLDTLEEIADALSDTATMEMVSAAISTKANAADLAPVATSGSYTDLLDTPTIPTVPTNVSSFTNDAGYLTQHQDISGKVNSSDLAAVATSGDYNDLNNTPTIPTNVSSLTNDANYITGMTILSYGSSTWNDFISAYNANKVVYCRASSNSNPASGSQTRLAFMAYVNNATNPTEVEFLYYRSVLTHSDNQLGDLVYVYKLGSNGTWSVTTRNAFTKIAAGTNMSSSYSNGLLTLSATHPDLTNYVLKSLTSGLLKNDGTVDTNTYLTSHLDISGKANTTDLSTVATTGSYNDLSDTPSDISEFNNDSEYVSYDKVTLENSSKLLKSAGDGIATINNIKGNTVAWNQLMPIIAADSRTSNGITITSYGNGLFKVDGTATQTADIAFNFTLIKTIVGHKLYLQTKKGLNVYYGVYNSGKWWRDVITYGTSIIYTAEHDGFLKLGVVVSAEETVNNVTFIPLIIDLTLIYGEGNEPSTAAEFEADYFRWFGKPLTYEPYDAGSLRPVLMSGIKTTGFNQWDEEWELGGINTVTGATATGTDRIRSKNYIPVIGGSNYHIHSDQFFNHISCYDIEKKFIASIFSGESEIDVIVPSNAAYAKFQIGDTANPNTTYNHDTCINISDPVKNGTYEPYEEHVKPLDITTLKGKLNGSGASVTVFPDGLKKAGSVYDEIKVEGGVVKAIKRVGSVDLGTLTWIYDVNGTRFYSLNFISNYNAKLNGIVICSKYTSGIDPNNLVDKSVALGSTLIAAKDSSYSDAAAFKTAMNGVMIYYELATPQEYILDDISIPINYYVNLYGTEELIHSENGVAATIVTTYNGELGKDLSKILPSSAILANKPSLSNITSQKLSVGGSGTTTSLEINSDSSSSIIFNGKNVQNNTSTSIMLMPASTDNSLMFLFPSKASANSPYTLATTSDIPSTTGMVTSTTTGLKIEVVLSLPASPDSNTIYIVLSAS